MINQLPVYLFTGFLEGGKTHIIQDIILKFSSDESVCVCVCKDCLVS